MVVTSSKMCCKKEVKTTIMFLAFFYSAFVNWPSFHLIVLMNFLLKKLMAINHNDLKINIFCFYSVNESCIVFVNSKDAAKSLCQKLRVTKFGWHLYFTKNNKVCTGKGGGVISRKFVQISIILCHLKKLRVNNYVCLDMINVT